ncbi:Hypothetical protein, putative [Bodo saltans]|uniref:Uncharacterized protein n=1 Tax=Bodo saltans TaxID=75058 RepID=A0A0S4JCA7_BODSA|nr:Hypothetical protein, putative [Bodo saltans]|eukprot:CUG88002.1 Hypothetical protein, putative [Bodo saltans]
MRHAPHAQRSPSQGCGRNDTLGTSTGGTQVPERVDTGSTRQRGPLLVPATETLFSLERYDGTIFLREKGAGRAWVVFLVQAVKRMAKDQHGMRQRETSHQTANDDVLPSGIADVDGNVHALRFVRILVTADPVDSISDVSNSASSIGSDLAKKVIAECFMDLDTIKEWCPTVGMFAGNLVKIRQLAGAV